MRRTMALLASVGSLLFAANTASAVLPNNYHSLTDEEAIEPLVLHLAEDVRLHKRFVIQELGGDADTLLPALHELLDKYARRKRRDVLDAIYWICREYPSETSIDPWMAQYERDPELAEDVFSAMTMLYDHTRAEKAFQAFVKIYMEKLHYHGFTHVFLRHILSRSSDASQIPVLEELLDRNVTAYTDLVMKRLVEIGKPDVVIPIIVKQLKRGNDYDRQVAIEILGESGQPTVTADLKEAMTKEKKKYIQVNIAEALVKLGDFESAEFLVNLVGSRYHDERGWGRNALVEVSGQDFGQNQQAWRHWFEEEKRRRGL